MPTAGSVGGWRRVGRADIRGGLLGEDGLLALAFVKGLNQTQGPVLAVGERAQALARPLAHLSRVGAEESRRGRDDLAVLEREVEREVMPLDPPAPLAAVQRLAEDREVIQLGVAHRAAPFLELPEDLLQAHDRRGLQETRPARPDWIRPNASARCSGLSSLIGSPLRARGMKCQLSRSGES